MAYDKSDTAKIKHQSNFDKQKKRSPRKITATYLHNSGLYYLERFSASKNHFKFVMLRKVKRSCMHHLDQNYDECAILVEELADKFENVGLLNDDVYTTGMVTSMRRKGLSRNVIMNKMKIKGIASEHTKIALEKLDAEYYENERDAEMNAALTLARKKKLGPYMGERDIDIKKALGIFARAGFSYDIAKYILDMDEAEIDEVICHQAF